MFSWFDSYDVYYRDGSVAYTVKGQLSWGHCMRIYDNQANSLGLIKEVVFSLLPRFEIYTNDRYVGSIRKEFSFFKPRFTMDLNGWTVDGDWLEWDYTIRNAQGTPIAVVSKEILNWTDTYSIDVYDPADALPVLLAVLAIDAEKCSRN